MVKSQKENKINVVKMRVLRWMCGYSRQDRIRSTCIKEKVDVASIVKKMIESRLGWTCVEKADRSSNKESKSDRG